jgi:Ca-activated chloride channel family protein
MFSQFSFEYPYVFLAIVIFIICAKYCKAKSSSYYIPHLNIYNQTTTINNQFITLIQWLLIIFALIALASPVKHLQTIHKKSDGIDIVLALDTSRSMRHIGFDRQNIEKNRWQVVQDIVKDFIPKRVNDNIAIVVFGTAVMTASPLSYDKEAQKEILSHLDIGVAGDKTALLDSIAASVNILKSSKAKSKIIILLTDGEDTASKIPYQVAIKLATKHNIKIYTIAIGQINQNLLHKIATATKGSFFKANSKDDLTQIYDQINKLEKSSLEQNKIVLKEYYFFYPLFFAIMLLVLFIYLKNKRGDL